jgi:FtsZ-interacting cell division protein ZipA
MDTTVLIWIIVAVVVVAIIIVLALVLTRRGRTEHRERVQHDKAEDLRADARESELAAREQEANAAQERANAAAAAATAQQAQAQAAQADVEAQRRAGNIGEYEAEAQERRNEQEESLRRADDVDPYVTSDETRDETDFPAEERTTEDGQPITRRRNDERLNDERPNDERRNDEV